MRLFRWRPVLSVMADLKRRSFSTMCRQGRLPLMQPRELPVIFKVAMQCGTLSLVLSAAACAPAPQPVVALPPPAPADPVIAFVSSGGIGQSASLTESPGGGSVTVTIETQYYSALGQVCRTYAIARPAGVAQSLACQGASGWRTVPPLVQGVQQAALP